MYTTEYAGLSTQDLTAFALHRDNRTTMEIELAQRLEQALAMLEEQDDARGKTQSRYQEAA